MEHKERISMRDLELELPVKDPEPWFDPERDLTDDDWRRLYGHLKELLERKKWWQSCWWAARMKVMRPGLSMSRAREHNAAAWDKIEVPVGMGG